MTPLTALLLVVETHDTECASVRPENSRTPLLHDPLGPRECCFEVRGRGLSRHDSAVAGCPGSPEAMAMAHGRSQPTGMVVLGGRLLLVALTAQCLQSQIGATAFPFRHSVSSPKPQTCAHGDAVGGGVRSGYHSHSQPLRITPLHAHFEPTPRAGAGAGTGTGTGTGAAASAGASRGVICAASSVAVEVCNARSPTHTRRHTR